MDDWLNFYQAFKHYDHRIDAASFVTPITPQCTSLSSQSQPNGCGISKSNKTFFSSRKYCVSQQIKCMTY